MPKISYTGKFDTDPQALAARERANINADFDFDKWVIDQLPLYDNVQVLDLGCGSCRHLRKIKELYPNCHLQGVDITSKETKIPITSISFDEYKPETTFDIVLSAYAIYYSVDMLNLLIKMRDWAKTIFICGPGEGSNQELTELSCGKVLPIPDFITPEELSTLSEYYSIEIVRLHNKVRFPHREDFYKWWKNHNSYTNHNFCIPEPWSMTKNVMGVKFHA